VSDLRIAKTDHPSPESYAHAAWFLSCEVAALRAVATVEAGPLGAFNDDGTPVILFERHKFEKHTQGRFHGARLPNSNAEWSLISWPTWGGYGPTSVQHAKLARAVALDRDAALKSASWGLFQILGENHAAAGFPDLQGFINAMYGDVDEHLRALVMFVRGNPRLHQALKARDWPVVAYHYNGPKFLENKWDSKMADAYARLTA
jgi:hypothetical protein